MLFSTIFKFENSCNVYFKIWKWVENKLMKILKMIENWMKTEWKWNENRMKYVQILKFLLITQFFITGIQAYENL